MVVAAGQPMVRMVSRKLGGKRALGVDIVSEADLAQAVGNRISLKALSHLARSGFSEREIEQFIIPARTRRHREARREALTVEESDRLVRMARIQSIAEDVLGDLEKANRWLRQGLGILDGKMPLEVARTEAGARVVEKILATLDWGAAA
jgi:putative toxin-antitoxin system antitoxin component (TIGR02293 family)